MSTSLEEYQVDHLFLLIGKNPLPNYVAAKTLLREGGIPYLVHTRDTLTSAQRLWEMLRDDVPELESDPLISLDDQESDAHYIKTKIEQQVGQIEKNEQVGLNYTGGTKAMSVHAYRALFKARPDAIFSYLDPRNWKCV